MSIPDLVKHMSQERERARQSRLSFDYKQYREMVRRLLILRNASSSVISDYVLQS